MAKKLIFRFGGSSSNNAEDYTGITKFKFRKLAAATKNFAPESLLGEGEYGRTFKGCLKRSGHDVVAIRQLDEESIHAIYECHDQTMLSTIRLRSLLHHPNIVDLIGYNTNDKDQMYFVYEFMPLGSLKRYLHGYQPKLSDFLLFKERIPEHDESSHARLFSRQCQRQSPEFVGECKITQKSDIYSFGLVLLELISGRVAEIKPSLIEWAISKLVYGKEFTTVADPLLNGHYPEQGLYQALSLAAQCLQHKDVARPSIGYVANVLSNLASETYDQNAIQINRAGTLAVGNIEKERLTAQWRHVRFFK
ncbi:hypothetical protein MKW98_030630 [Papaver atlanticum]|uniref:Protein kinase domain-containing protein n=1 Tax=Papaver atlanticum TaxID=357466 RepID=A0AAD4X3D0_9MAGN|nr:hypothetical protein MKW98_030630 [Papaver atlanticum]